MVIFFCKETVKYYLLLITDDCKFSIEQIATTGIFLFLFSFFLQLSLSLCIYLLQKNLFHSSFSVCLPPVFDYAYRDYILSWYIPLSRDEGQLYSMLSDDWRQMIGQLRSRLADIDLVNVVCYDTIRILHTHFTDLKAASVR